MLRSKSQPAHRSNQHNYVIVFHQCLLFHNSKKYPGKVAEEDREIKMYLPALRRPLNLLASHARHVSLLDAPSVLEYAPAEHAVHTIAETAPSVVDARTHSADAVWGAECVCPLMHQDTVPSRNRQRPCLFLLKKCSS